MALPEHDRGTPPLQELAAGIDALYLSGRGSLPSALLESLEAARTEAAEAGEPADVEVGGSHWRLAGHGWGKYRFCLDNVRGRVGLTDSDHLPTVRIQPRAELLHAIGPADTVQMMTKPFEAALGPLTWSVSRVDVHSDWQGLTLHRSMSERFVGRADARAIFEDADLCTGFTFGAGKGGGLSARLYDKVAEINRTGNDYWFDVWGERYDPTRGVHWLEFQWGREALRSMQLNTPVDVLAATGDLWKYGTTEWLTLRNPTSDETKSRWPIAPEWADIQRSSLNHDLLGVARLKEGSRKGALRLLMPLLNGCASSAAVHLGTEGISDTLQALGPELQRYARSSGEEFPARVARKRREWSV